MAVYIDIEQARTLGSLRNVLPVTAQPLGLKGICSVKNSAIRVGRQSGGA